MTQRTENIKRRQLLPGSVADWADHDLLLLDMGSDARKVKGMRALGCENGRTLTTFHALQADSASTLKREKRKTVIKKGNRNKSLPQQLENAKKKQNKMLTLLRRKVDLRREKLEGDDFGDDGLDRWNSLGL